MTKEHANQVRMLLARYDKLQDEIQVMRDALEVLVGRGDCRVSFGGEGFPVFAGSCETPNLMRVLYSAIACEKGRLERDCENLNLSHCDKM
jgi:hypothetical protein